MTPDELAKIAAGLLAPGPVGTFTLIVIGLWALHRGHVRLGREVVKLEEDLARANIRADKWQEIAYAQLQHTDRAIAVAQKATKAIGGPADVEAHS